MATTRSFKNTVKDRVGRDASFHHALLGEIEDAIRAGDMDTGRAILRDYIEDER